LKKNKDQTASACSSEAFPSSINYFQDFYECLEKSSGNHIMFQNSESQWQDQNTFY